MEDALTIKGIRFFTDQQIQYSRDYVYLGEASSYFQDPRYADALLLANGQNQIICRGAEYEELLNDVLAAFDYYNVFEQKLYMAAAKNQPLNEMMNIIETVLSSPFFVFDIDGNLIGKCHDEIELDESFSFIKTEKFLGSHTIGQIFVDKNGRISHDLAEYPQLLHVTDHQEIECAAIYLYQNEERIGFALLFASNPHEAAIGMCLEPMLANVCAEAAEFTDKSSVHQSDHSILLQLLRKENVSPAISEKFQQHLGFTSTSLLLTYEGIAIRNYTFRHMLCKEFNHSGIAGISCEYQELVVILTDEKNISQVLNFIAQKTPATNFSIGISMPVQKTELLHIAFQQSVFALRSTDTSGIRYCRDLAFPYLLQNLRKVEMSFNLRHPIIEILQEYDEKNETELLETLRIYVRTGCKQADTAAKMHIHLNTLKYRLHRIIELSGVDFKNYDELFYIQLSLAL